jgi:hypothetical protein
VQSLVCLILIKRLRRRRAGLRGEPCHGSHDGDGDRAGMLLASSGRCGAIDAIVVHIGWQSDGCCSRIPLGPGYCLVSQYRYPPRALP